MLYFNSNLVATLTVHQAIQDATSDVILRPARKHYKLMSVARERRLDGFFECGLLSPKSQTRWLSVSRTPFTYD